MADPDGIERGGPTRLIGAAIYAAASGKSRGAPAFPSGFAREAGALASREARRPVPPRLTRLGRAGDRDFSSARRTREASSVMAAGVMPSMRLACAMLRGRICSSLARISPIGREQADNPAYPGWSEPHRGGPPRCPSPDGRDRLHIWRRSRSGQRFLARSRQVPARSASGFNCRVGQGQKIEGAAAQAILIDLEAMARRRRIRREAETLSRAPLEKAAALAAKAARRAGSDEPIPTPRLVSRWSALSARRDRRYSGAAR